MNIYIPYTYLIGWSKHNLWYYGCQYGQHANPANLWNPYKTSSRYVEDVIDLYGDPDIIKIRKTFKDEKTCRLWEHKVLRRLKVIHTDKWLNKTDNIAISPECSKISKTKGKTYVEILGEERADIRKGQIRKSNTLRGCSDNTRNKISNKRIELSEKGLLNIVYTVAWKEKQAEPFPKQPNVICDNCGISMSKGNYIRWHKVKCRT